MVRTSASKENSPSVRKSRRNIMEENCDSADNVSYKTPTKKEGKTSRSGTPINLKNLKIQMKRIELKHCSDEDLHFIQDITNSKRKRASIKPKLEDVQEGSTEDDDDDIKETIAVIYINKLLKNISPFPCTIFVDYKRLKPHFFVQN